MKEPNPILVLGNDREIIALYDPTIIGGPRVEGSYAHTREKMRIARDQARMTESMYKTSLEHITNAKKGYLASMIDYNERETALEIGLGDVINEEGAEELMFEAMQDAKEISLGDLNTVRNMQKYTNALKTLKRQSRKLERIASRIN